MTKSARDAARRMICREKLLGYGLRVAIAGAGLNGFEYTLAFCEGPGPGDLIFQSDGFLIYVDPASHPYVNGMTIDFVNGGNGKGFVFLDPDATPSSGKGGPN